MSIRKTKAALAAAMLALAGTAESAVLHPDSLGVAGSGRAPHAADLLLTELAFGGVDHLHGPGRVGLASLEVTAGRSSVNAEWGDADTTDPMTATGHPGAWQETRRPGVQDAALAHAFTSASLTEMTDTEGDGTPVTLSLIFERPLLDATADPTPEIVLFERGMNDRFTLSPILAGPGGGTTTAPGVTIDSANFMATGLRVDTREIGAAQELGVGGIDLGLFALAPGTPILGLEVAAAGAEGPDLKGIFLTGDVAAVPLPATGGLLLGALAFLAWRRRA